MIEYLNGEVNENDEERMISKKFWFLYSELNKSISSDNILHGQFKARFSISYLKKNQDWVN